MGHLTALSFTLILIVGCRPREQDGTRDEKQDSGLGHRDAIARCDGDREALAADSEVPPTEIMTSWIACLERANDALIRPLEAALAEAVSNHAGMVAARLASARTMAQGLCTFLTDSSTDPGQPFAGLIVLDCIGAMERNIGRLFDAWADTTTEPEPIPDDRDDFEPCYAQFGSSRGDGDEAPSGEALFGLEKCVIAHLVDMRVPPIVERILASSSGGVSDDVERAVRSELSFAVDGHGDICGIAGDSFGGGQIGAGLAAGCHIDAVALLDDILASFERPE